MWCATAEFADSTSKDWKRPGLGLGYHTTQEPYLRYSSLSDNRFTFRGKEYQVWSMFTTPGMHPDVVPGSPGRIPEYSTFSIRLMEVVGGELELGVDREHQRDWTLYVDGIALPFTDAMTGNGSGNSFIWHHPKLQDLFANWTDGDTYEIMVAEDPVDDRPGPPVTIPTAPRYLRVIPGEGSLVTIWKPPLKDGNSDVTHYRLQWKLGTQSWGNPNAVEEAIVQPFGGGLDEVFHMITGLSDYTLYTLRVIAVNGVGDSEPSAEHFGMPQEESLDVADTVVNGNKLTITYGRPLDGGSVPSQESFRVLVNGAPRNVTGVSISGRSVILTLEEPAKRAIRATDEVEFLYLMPPSGSPAIKDTLGNYAYSCEFGEPPSEARNETDPGLLEPVTAEFTMVPAFHDGPGTEVIFRIEFSEPVRVDMGRNYAHLLDVEGGKATSAWWLDRDTTIWEIVLEPASNDEVRITLPSGRTCDARGATCGSGDRPLSNQPEHTIPGPSSMLISNSPASGGPAIVGTPQTGQTLSATTTGIQDLDGMSGAVFAYQWIRHDLGTATDAEIDGATGKTYTVTSDDEGMALKVNVTFSDDAGNEESLTSFAVVVPPSESRNDDPVNNPATGSPAVSGTATVGQTLTATTSGIADEDGTSAAVYSYQWLADDFEISGATSSTYRLVASDEGSAISVVVTFTDDAGNAESLTSLETSPVEAASINTPASGQPTIMGEAKVGKTLTVNTSGISDADGMAGATFTYGWVAGGSNINGATGASYVLTASEQGQQIEVKVSFTDDLGNAETLTSLPTSAVEAAQTNTPASGLPTITGDAKVGETLSVSTSGISDADGMEDAVFAYQWVAGGSNIEGATGASHVLTASQEGQQIEVKVSFTDDAGSAESLTSLPTSPVEAAQTNTPASGRPTITGDAKVGEILSVSTSGISDADGIEGAEFHYQWYKFDGESFTLNEDASGSSYTLGESDVGKRIRVLVIFRDEGGNVEALFSSLTAAVVE